MISDPSPRSIELDGIRGWAALMVACSHFFWATFKMQVPWLVSPWFGLVFNGEYMVMVFFVLSGDVLSSVSDRNDGDLSLRRIAFSRYFRLTFLVLASSVAVWFLLFMGWTWNREAGLLVGSQNWLAGFLDFSPSLPRMLHFALDGVYFHYDPDTAYNPFLWTMPIELLGSALVFLNLFVLRSTKHYEAALWLQAVFFLLLEPYYALFYAGMILRHRCSSRPVSTGGRLPLAILAVLLVGMTLAGSKRLSGETGYVSQVVGNARFQGIGAVGLVWILRRYKVLNGFFRARISAFLGEISFPLYVLQFPVLVSATSGAIVALHAKGGLTQGICLAIASFSLLLSIALAWLLRKIERRYLDVLRRFVRRFLTAD